MMDLSLVLLASNSTELLWFKGEWFLLFLQLRGKWCLLILEGFSQTVFFFLRERESLNLWRLLLMIALYHQTKTPISFWCKRGLNPRSLIQPSETLPVELTRTTTVLVIKLLYIKEIYCYSIHINGYFIISWCAH